MAFKTRAEKRAYVAGIKKVAKQKSKNKRKRY